ncbi:trissin receptor-like [Leptidea sinapis]|uniref:trissin receptor-like n=1 Tax=Leptidea sinapis TaxID=189913 RepID=UPI002128AA8D|nr:trissin receptor-like [Leptidea sinapis]XP_050675836.1 trissin receptor-like [Leptidea sinapis]XP_050675837.1 trissin receptor-like [Leptidea sinapis]
MYNEQIFYVNSSSDFNRTVKENVFVLGSNSTENETQYSLQHDEFIFDRTDVRAIFITLYTIVFCCCFFGNLLVILVVTLSRRLRSITNFFLANLAVADLCVGVFCVFQNLSIYLIPSWVFGDFLCKMYQFVHSLSYTASIFILVVICTERYFAIIHPITCKQILTSTRLRMVIVGVWITSAAYSAPKFIWVETITNDLGNGHLETICIQHRMKYNSEVFDMVNFGLLYVTPLCVMTVLYTRIAVGLWQSSKGLRQMGHGQCCATQCPRTDKPSGNCEPQRTFVGTQETKGNQSSTSTVRSTASSHSHESRNCRHLSHLSRNVLRARRGVVRMLIVVVLTFAVCNLPFHARKMWQYWSSGYEGTSDFSALLTPLTFLITYFNSGINPLLYAFLSKNFRKGMRELLLCSLHAKRKSENVILLNRVGGVGLRRSSTRSTRANCSTITMAPNGHGES